MKTCIILPTKIVLIATLIFLSILALYGVGVENSYSRLGRFIPQDNQIDTQEERERRLIKILTDKKLLASEPETVVQAILGLGNIRSVGAIDELIKLLGFRRSFPADSAFDPTESHPVTLTGRYPAGGALFQIGEPAIPALINVIQTRGCDEVESQVAVEAVRGIFRDKMKEGLKDLRERGSRQAKLAAKPCFEKLLEDMAKRG